MEGRIRVPAPVLEGLEAVYESGQTSMFDVRRVRAVANRLGYPETVLWIEENRETYIRGLLRGFEAE